MAKSWFRPALASPAYGCLKTDTQALGEGASVFSDRPFPNKTLNTKLFSSAAYCLYFPKDPSEAEVFQKRNMQTAAVTHVLESGGLPAPFV